MSRTSTQEADTPQPVRFTNVDQIVVKAVSENKVSRAMTQITDLLRERHRIRDGDEEDFSIRDMAEMMKMMSSTTQLMSSLLLVVAMISLVVGGVGIMNIMLVSVTERTREIGLRMAVGARSHHILRQFLVEAVVLCLVGGGDRHRVGPRRIAPGAMDGPLAHTGVVGDDRRRRGRLGRRRRGVRLLSRLEGLAVGPDRSLAVRVSLAATRHLSTRVVRRPLAHARAGWRAIVDTPPPSYRPSRPVRLRKSFSGFTLRSELRMFASPARPLL